MRNIRCPHCGADYSHLTLDVKVTISCCVFDDNTFDLKDYWNLKNLTERVIDPNNEATLFCEQCGWDLQTVELDYVEGLGTVVLNEDDDNE